MLKVTSNVFGSDRRERCCYRIYQGLFGPGCCLAEQILDLGKGLFDEPTTVRLHTHASLSGYTIILSPQLDPLPVSMVSARQFMQPAKPFELRFVGPHYPASSVTG
jgi:hypothetical protein